LYKYVTACYKYTVDITMHISNSMMHISLITVLKLGCNYNKYIVVVQHPDWKSLTTALFNPVKATSVEMQAL